MMVFDESVSIANPNSAQGKSCVDLAMMCPASRNLDGLPNPNGPHEFFMQLRAVRAPVGPYFPPFRNQFCEMGGYQNAQVVGARNVKDLARVMKGKVFFADKLTWAPTLPKKLYASRYIDMSPEQMRAYKTMANELYAEIEGKTITLESALAKSTKLQCIASGYLYDEDRQVHWIHKNSNPKIEAAKEFIAHADGKTIIFAHFKPSVDQLLEAFPGCAHALSKSRMTDDELERQKDRFNNDPSCRVFVAPLSVMQYGHTLVGNPTNPCTSSLFYENTFSRRTRSQAEDRNHRWGAVEGRDAAILYCDLICSPVDAYVIRALKSKGDLAESLLTALKEIIHAN
jgi:hypothetical protein